LSVRPQFLFSAQPRPASNLVGFQVRSVVARPSAHFSPAILGAIRVKTSGKLPGDERWFAPRREGDLTTQGLLVLNVIVAGGFAGRLDNPVRVVSGECCARRAA
jgi:hypothetical protein